MNTKADVNKDALAALDAGIAAADGLAPGQDAELLSVPAPAAESVETPPADTHPADTPPAADTPPEVTPDAVTPPAGEPAAEATPTADDAATAEANAAAADAEEAKSLGFKNQKGVEAYQRVKAESRAAVAERDTLRRQIEEDWQPRAEAFTKFRDHMESIGCKPEQFGLAVSMIDAMNSGDPKKLEAVAVELENQLGHVRGKLGLATKPGEELYQTDPELAQAVADGDITPKHANELARIRKLEAATSSHATATADAQRQAAERQTADAAARDAAVQEAAGELDALGARLHKLEPDVFKFKAKTAIDEFLKVRDSVHPSKWEATYRRIYDDLPGPPKAAITKPAGNVPLRTTGTPGGAAPVSSSPMDALNAGLEAARNGATW